MTQLTSYVLDVLNQASDLILGYYHQPDLVVNTKSDDTPVTVADAHADRFLREQLTAWDPTLPILSEEGTIPEASVRATWDRYWLVDPLDGTKDFVAQTDEFSINIALVEGGRATKGWIHVPVQGITYYCDEPGVVVCQPKGQEGRVLQLRPVQDPVRCLVSRHHHHPKWRARLDAVMKADYLPCGSAYKFCRLAEGSADIYFRSGPTSMWDTAAGQCLLEALGGGVIDLAGQPLRYPAERQILNPPFLAYANPQTDWHALFSTLRCE